VGLEEIVDPVPKKDGFVVGNEIRFASGVVVLSVEGGFGAEVGVDDVVDIAEVNAVVAVADDAEFAFVAAFEDTRDEIRVARSPDEVWTEGDGFQVPRRLIVGIEDGFFGDDFAGRIRTGNVGPVGEGFVGSGEVLVVEDDAWRAGVDEFRNEEVATAVDDRLGADNVGVFKIFAFAPDADFGGCVKNGIHVRASASGSGRVREIDIEHFDSERFELRLRAAAKSGYRAALF